MRRVYILPNLFTAGNLFCGLLAIFEIMDLGGEGDPVRACQLIFIAGVLDVFDGLVARLTNSQSAFGLHFDSLADVISFGAAPALMIYTAVSAANPPLAKATCGMFVICAAMRLARFNVQAGNEERHGFTGLPTPGAGCLAVSLFWVIHASGALPAGSIAEKIIPLAMVMLAYLMVSKVPYPGLKSIPLAKRGPFEILVSIVLVLFMLVALKQHIDKVLLVGLGTYAAASPAKYLYLFLRGSSKAGPWDGADEASRDAVATAAGPADAAQLGSHESDEPQEHPGHQGQG